MICRRLTLIDLESYFENRLRALKNSPSAFLTTYDEEIAKGQSHFEKTLSHLGNEKAIFGAIENNQVIATIGIYQQDRPKTAHKAGIWGMYVDEAFRKKGIGLKLLDSAIQFAHNEMKVKQIHLSIESTNKAARSLYESKGFKVWGVEPQAMKTNNHYFNEDHMVLIFI